jgi:hypothetical protein
MTAKSKRTKDKSSSSSKASASASDSNHGVNRPYNVPAAIPTKTLEDSQQPPANNPNLFSKAQLAAIIILMTGASKIREFHLSLKEEGGETCMTFLKSEETCSHPNFTSLIQVKYFSAISLALLVTTFVFQLWLSENYLIKFISCLTISPLIATMVTLAVVALGPHDAHLQNPMAWQLYSTTTATILFGLVRPSSITALPFLPPSIEDRSSVSIKFLSLQAVGLVALTVGTLWEMTRVYLPGASGDAGLQNALLVTDSPLPTPAKSLVYSWTIDRFVMTLLYAFAVYHLPIFKQRSILLASFLIKLSEYAYQLPNLKNPWQDQGAVEQMTLGLAILSAVAWIAPDVSLD